MNGNTLHDDPLMNDPKMKLKLHFNRYQQEYILLASGVAMGLALGGIFRGRPKIDEAAIVTKWMEKTAQKGFNVYALTNEQKALWESAWRYAEAQQQRLGWPLSEIVEQMTRDYADVLGYGPALNAIKGFSAASNAIV